MAYTKVFAIRARLDDRVKYAVNGEKTELDERIVYTADPEKTDTVRFVTTLNCRSADGGFWLAGHPGHAVWRDLPVEHPGV